MHADPSTVLGPEVAPPAHQRLNECAVASIVLGALGIVCPIGLGFLALWLARRAQRQIEAGDGRAEDRDLASVGAGLAWAGISLTVVIAVGIAIIVVLSLLLPALLLLLL